MSKKLMNVLGMHNKVHVTIDSGNFILGNKTESFENSFAEY